MNVRRFAVVGDAEDQAEDANIEKLAQRDPDRVDPETEADTIGSEAGATESEPDARESDLGLADPDPSSRESVGGGARQRPVPSTIAPSHPRVSEAVRYMLDRYGMTSAEEFPSTIGVVSALRREGVTTVSQSLAEVLAVDFGYTVCWVDLSWAEGAPTPQRGFRDSLRRRRNRSRGGDARQPGILNVITGDAELDDVLRSSENNRLAHLAAGSTSGSLRKITRSVELGDLLEELLSRFEIVVLDNAPVSDNSSALSLIQYAEAYVFVTQYGTTTAHQVDESTQMLSPLPPMGAVLNAYRSRTPRFIRRFFAAER